MAQRKLVLEGAGFIKRDGAWYQRIGVSDDGHTPKQPVSIVEHGYTCRDGVWNKCVSVSET